MPNDTQGEFTSAAERALTHLREMLSQIRTDRATPALVEKIPVEAYGAVQPVVALASISIADARTLVIQAWDPALGAAIGKAIGASALGVNPTVDGAAVRVTLPTLTTERRTALWKAVSEKREGARIAIRAARDEAIKKIREQERAGALSEDAARLERRSIDSAAEEANTSIGALVAAKERELEPT
jgi:ribosome recycling factor